MQIKTRYKKRYWLAALLCACMACNDDAGGNKVTVNPTPAPSQSETAAQKGMDKSPMDMCYYPVNYPVLKIQNKVTGPPVARVIYSRPQKNGRVIFGNVVKYGTAWRMGANEATEIEFFQNVSVNNQRINKGRYILYCIPQEKTWTVVLNNDLYTWGLKIDSTLDAYKFDIPIARTNFPFEVLTMEFEQADKGMQLVMEWDSVRAILPIEY